MRLRVILSGMVTSNIYSWIQDKKVSGYELVTEKYRIWKYRGKPNKTKSRKADSVVWMRTSHIDYEIGCLAFIL
jgi:hypothetical protein